MCAPFCAARARALLTRPARVQERGHKQFVCRLRERWPLRETLGLRVAQQLAQQGYTVLDTPLEAAERFLALPHLSSSVLLDAAALRAV